MKLSAKRIIKIAAYKVDALMCRIFLNIVVRRSKYTKAHVSFDDVSEMLSGDVSKTKLFTTLEQWRTEMGLKVHLYLFAISDKQEAYLEGLCYRARENMKGAPNSEGGGIAWLTIAPHEPESLDDMVPLINKNLLSESVRFHGYKASKEELAKAQKYGIDVFLCDDLDRISYDLADKEHHLVNARGSFEKEGRAYLKTNIRLERLVLWQFIKSKNFDTIVIFGHEWAFDYDKERLEIILKVLSKNDIHFI